MAVKSVIDVEVNDDAFKEFAALFEKYKAALGVTPGVWANANAAAAGTAVSVESLVAGLLTHEAINKKIAREEEAKSRAMDKETRALERQRVLYRDVAKSVGSVLGSITKWASYATVGGGLLGFGSFFGIERLTGFANTGRRTAQGLGTTIGESKAFENSYDRIVDARSFLGGVNEALTDVTKRASLFGAGLSNKDIAGKDTAQVANELLPALKKLADRTPDAQLAQLLAARGLGQFTDVEGLRRLKATSPEELASIQAGFGAKRNQFDVEDGIARKWQDLGVQLDSAKIKIEGTLVKGLEPLAKPLADLSDSIANALKIFLTGLDPSTLKDLGKGIEDFAKYLSGDQFRKDLKTFADDVSYASKKMVSALKWLDLIPDKGEDPTAPTVGDKAKSVAVGTVVGAAIGGTAGALAGPGGALAGARAGAWIGGLYGLLRLRGGRLLGENAHWTGAPSDTNPGNIRFPGVNKGFAAFESSEAGVRAIARQVKLYEVRDHLDTIRKIIAKYAPKKDHNDVEAYVRDVEKTTGIGADARLDAKSDSQLAKIVAAITKHEGVRAYSAETVSKYIKSGEDASAKTATTAPPASARAPAATKGSDRKVSIVIENNTGGSAVVQSGQAAKQG